MIEKFANSSVRFALNRNTAPSSSSSSSIVRDAIKCRNKSLGFMVLHVCQPLADEFLRRAHIHVQQQPLTMLFGFIGCLSSESSTSHQQPTAAFFIVCLFRKTREKEKHASVILEKLILYTSLAARERARIFREIIIIFAVNQSLSPNAAAELLKANSLYTYNALSLSLFARFFFFFSQEKSICEYNRAKGLRLLLVFTRAQTRFRVYIRSFNL